MRVVSLRRPVVLALALVCAACAGQPPDLEPYGPTPSPEQLAYHAMEMAGFIHFSINTFTDREWGFGDESPNLFAPTSLHVDQWVQVAKEAGMGELILTTKHHDGFCLWPSETTDHTVAASPWRGGGGDLVGEFAAAAREQGLAVGMYLSPWDRNHAAYGTPEYLEAYRAQLTELLTRYGDVAEIWVDGANGGDGYYGGANEERRIDRRSYYRWPETMGMVKKLQPSALIFSDAGPDIRWIGNERGFAGETNWSTITTRDIVIGEADVEYLNKGDPAGEDWTIPLCDTSIRPGWFYHPDQDDQVKSPQELVDLYYRSVGRNCVLLLNIPPDQRGLLHENDVRALREFRRILDETFATDLAMGARVEAESWRMGDSRFSPANVVDGNPETYWAAAEGTGPWRQAPEGSGSPGQASGGSVIATLEIFLAQERDFDRILLQEPIRFGQRVSRFFVQVRQGEEWIEVAQATTIGYKRILRIPPARADAVRIVISHALAPPALSTVGIFKASSDEELHP